MKSVSYNQMVKAVMCGKVLNYVFPRLGSHVRQQQISPRLFALDERCWRAWQWNWLPSLTQLYNVLGMEKGCFSIRESRKLCPLLNPVFNMQGRALRGGRQGESEL